MFSNEKKKTNREIWIQKCQCTKSIWQRAGEMLRSHSREKVNAYN